MLCGFHALFNATNMINAIISDSDSETVVALTNLNSSARFHAYYYKTVKKLMAVDNNYYVNKTD